VMRHLNEGTIRYLEASAPHRFSARGELLEVIGTHVDVTERKRAQVWCRGARKGILRDLAAAYPPVTARGTTRRC
jgi:hypothetical protein